MTPEQTNSLQTFFPSVFKDSFYFECESGWYNIIFNLAKKITMITDKCFAVQVKEKFHGLRFYVGWASDEAGLPLSDDQAIDKIWDLISEAENESYIICEICGKTKNKRDRYCSDCCTKLFK